MTNDFVNQDVLQRFVRLKERGRLAHAYLFTGPAGSGKSATARAVAARLNCASPLEASACGECPPCRRIASGNFPDVTGLAVDEGENIKIAAVRELIGRMALRPFESEIKIHLIHDIERLTPDAANALLKSLEEPAPGTLLLLTTSVPERNLGTIVSRCQPMRFFPVPRRRLAAALAAGRTADREETDFLAAYSEGCLARARALQEAGFFRRKNEIIDKLVFLRNNEKYLKKELSDKARTREVLEVLLAWFRDLLLIKSGEGDRRAVNADRAVDLQRAAAKTTFAQLEDTLARIVHARRMLADNLNVKISMRTVMESVWLN